MPLPELQEEIKNILRKNWGADAEKIKIISISNLHVDVSLVNGLELDISAFKSWRPEYAESVFVLENDKYICGS